MSVLFNLSLMPSPFTESVEPPSIGPAAVLLASAAETSASALYGDLTGAEAAFSIQSSDGAAESFREVQAEMGRGKSKPPSSAVAPVASPSEAFSPPAGYVLLAQADLDRAMVLLAGMQEWQEDYMRLREHMELWQADYERLLELERVELLTPPPMFLRSR